MPAVAVAVVASVAAKAVGALVANAVLSAVLSAVVGGIISYAASAMFATKPKFDSPDLSKLAGRTQMVRQPVVTRKIVYGETQISGPVTFLNVTNGKRSLQWLITLTGHSVAEIGDIWFGDQIVFEGSGSGSATGRYAGYARFWKGTGTDDGDADLLAAMRERNPGKWTVDHRQRGCGKLYCELTWDPDIYPGGIPQIKCLVKGKNDIRDPRDHSVGYTDNWALCVADYIAGDHGLAAGWGAIDSDDLIASANVADEDIDLAEGGTEKRYSVSGLLDTGSEPQNNLRDLLNPGAGIATRSGQTWRVLAGYFREGDLIEITDDWLAGPVRVRPYQSADKAFNEIRAVYAGPKSNWQPTDLPVRKSAAFLAADGGKASAADREYLLTRSASAGQRLMQMELYRSRLETEIDVVCNLRAFAVRVGSVVRVTRTRNGWTLKPFEVVNWKLRQDIQDDVPVLLIDLTLREIDGTAFDWSTTDEQIVTAVGQSDLPHIWDVAPPDGLSVTEVLYSTRDGGGVKSKVVLVAGVADDGFVVSYQFEYRELGVLEWTALAPVPSPDLEIFDAAAGIYDLRVKAVNRFGASSEYVTVRREIYGLAGKPSVPVGLTIASLGGFAVLQWQQSTDLDVLQGGEVRLRWSPSQSGAELSNSGSVGNALPGGSVQAVVPLRPGSYLVQFVDASGTASDPGVISTDAATILEYADVASVVENPAWSGVTDGTVIADGKLVLNGSGLIDDIPDFDAVVSIDAWGGIAISGTYGFASGFDFTVKSRKRLTASVDLLVVSVIDTIDDRTGTVDEWDSFDGDALADGDCSVWFRTTDDDPDASPVWSDWQRLDVAEVNCRAVSFEARLSVSDQSYNIEISDLRVIAADLA
ncbi:MAG: hypothetical protein ABID63_18225 [Pseudomonadota bacterium]